MKPAFFCLSQVPYLSFWCKLFIFNNFYHWMISRNKFEKVFGPFGSSTGFFLFIGGIITTYFSLFGVVITILGSFIAFTSTCTYIDTENRRVRFCHNIFGIIPVGKWMEIKPDMKIGLKRSHLGYRAYTRGAQPTSIHIRDVRICLYAPDKKEIMPIEKFDSYLSAKSALVELNSKLRLTVI